MIPANRASISSDSLSTQNSSQAPSHNASSTSLAGMAHAFGGLALSPMPQKPVGPTRRPDSTPSGSPTGKNVPLDAGALMIRLKNLSSKANA